MGPRTMSPKELKPEDTTAPSSNEFSVVTSIAPIPVSIPDQLLPLHQTKTQQTSSLAQRSFEEISEFVKQTTFSMTNLNIDENEEMETHENPHMTLFMNKRDEMNALTVCIII